MIAVQIKKKEDSGRNVIARLEEALAIAKEGNIANVVIVAVMDDGDAFGSFANNNYHSIVVDELELIKKDLTDSRIESKSFLVVGEE